MRYTQPLPQHPPAYPPPPVVHNQFADAVANELHNLGDNAAVAAVRAEYDEQIRGLKLAAAALAEELHQTRQAELDRQRERNKAERERDEALQSGFRLQHENRRLRNGYRGLLDANAVLRTELGAALQENAELRSRLAERRVRRRPAIRRPTTPTTKEDQ